MQKNNLDFMKITRDRDLSKNILLHNKKEYGADKPGMKEPFIRLKAPGPRAPMSNLCSFKIAG
jgi:hypothetical protein